MLASSSLPENAMIHAPFHDRGAPGKSGFFISYAAVLGKLTKASSLNEDEKMHGLCYENNATSIKIWQVFVLPFILFKRISTALSAQPFPTMPMLTF